MANGVAPCHRRHTERSYLIAGNRLRRADYNQDCRWLRLEDHPNTRILHTMVTGIPIVWALKLDCRILVFVWCFEPLKDSARSHGAARPGS